MSHPELYRDMSKIYYHIHILHYTTLYYHILPSHHAEAEQRRAAANEGSNGQGQAGAQPQVPFEWIPALFQQVHLAQVGRLSREFESSRKCGPIYDRYYRHL